MSVTPIAGAGTILKITLSSSLTAIPSVTRISPPGWTQDKIETTDLDSTWSECVAAIPDAGAISGELIFNPSNATHALLDDYADSSTVVAMEIIPVAGGKKYTFNGFISAWTTAEVNPKSVHKKNFTIQPTGAITRATSS